MPMSARSGTRSRALGSLRQTSTLGNTSAHVPNISIPTRSTVQPANAMSVGIQGSAMTLPNPKLTSRRSSTSLRSREESLGAVSHEACEREMKQVLAREAQLKDQIKQLQKEIAALKDTLSNKETVILTLTDEKDALAKKCEEEVKVEKERHAATQEDLESTRRELQDSHTQLHDLQTHSKLQLEQLQAQMEDLRAAKDKEIAERDETLKKLKKQMADSLKGNSLERQQQLEELGRDLIAIKKECDMLRNSLKTMAKSKSMECSNCKSAKERAEMLAVTLKEREVNIKDLKSLCAKFEKQLSQQDVLLKQWADSKGYDMKLPK